MAGNVIELRPREPQEAHLYGAAHCMLCKHKWQAVASIGTGLMECPSCGAVRGVYTRHVSYAGRCPSFRCVKCQGELFTAFLNQDVPTLGCAECGELHHAMSLFP